MRRAKALEARCGGTWSSGRWRAITTRSRSWRASRSADSTPTARLILRDDGRAEDATQEALVAAWRDLSALRDPDRFDAWLHRLLVRACYREIRRGRHRWTIEVDVDGHDVAPTPTRPSTSPTATSSSVASAASMPTSGRSSSCTTTSA